MALAISICDVRKEYRLGVLNHGTLFKDLQSRWARLRGKPDPNGPLFETSHAGARRRGSQFWALDGISLDIEEGETLGIIGRNGAGKSTLLKILSRITMPTAGSVRIKGRTATLLEVGTGFHPELTGRENVFLNGAILGMTRREIARKLDEIIAFSEIEQFIDTPVKRYSSGMYVRLAFAVAAHLEPEIMIVDEVLAVGDLNFQKKCFGRLGEIKQHGRTVLFVSHNLAAVTRLCRNCALLEDGVLVAHGPTSGVISEYVKRGTTPGPLERVFEEPMGPGCRAKFRRLRLESDTGRLTDRVDIAEGFQVCVEYELADTMLGLIVAIEIHSEEFGIAVLAVNDCELDHSKLERRAPGSYAARIRIPERILNTGAYHVRCGMVQARSIVEAVEGPVFHVEDRAGEFGALGFDRKSAVIALAVPWTTEALA